MDLPTCNAEALDAVRAEFEAGARSVLLREHAGMGANVTAAALVAGRAATGRCLVVCPAHVVAQSRAEVGRLAPDLRLGDLGSGADVEFAAPVRVASRLDGIAPDAYALVHVAETTELDHARIRAILARLAGADVLLTAGFGGPRTVGFEADSEIDRVGGPGTGRRVRGW